MAKEYGNLLVRRAKTEDMGQTKRAPGSKPQETSPACQLCQGRPWTVINILLNMRLCKICWMGLRKASGVVNA